MQLKLTAVQETALGEVESWLASTRRDLDNGIATFNEALETARIVIQPLLDAYVEAIEGARDLAFEVADGAEQVIKVQTEEWRGDAKAEAAYSFYEAWNSIALNLPDTFDIPEQMQLPEHDAADMFRKAPHHMQSTETQSSQ